MSEKAPSTGLTWKLIAGFILSTALIGFAAWFAYQNFNKLLGSVETLSNPNNSAEELQNLIYSMHEADANMRNYIMTDDPGAFQSYMTMMENMSVELDDLKQDRNFASNEKSLDSLEDYLNDKADLMYSLVIFKKSSEYERLNSKALAKISSNLDDEGGFTSAKSDNVTTKTPTIKQPSIKQAESTTDKSKKTKKEKDKDEGFLKNLFSGKNKNNKTQTSDPTIVALKDSTNNSKSTAELQFDISNNPSVDVEDVRQVLREIENEQRQYNTTLTIKELEILASDKIIIKKINELIDRIKSEQITLQQAQLIAANNNAKRSSQTMLIIASIALLSGLVFMGIILVDINRSNRYKKELIVARNRAEYLAHAKEEFLANMSHEIRTPLNAIIGFSEQMESTPLQPSQKKYIKAVSNAGAHLLNTVNDILDLSKIEAGKLAIDDQPFKLKEAIDEVVSIMEIKAKEKQLTLTVSPIDFANEYVIGDAFRIKQILYNIAGNAIKFTDKGKIEISGSAKKHKSEIEYHIHVTDTGVGIAPDKIDKIFESFEQAENAITRKFGGTGLGLSISKKLAALIGGNIAVKSEINKGSTFTITLPLPVADEKTISTILHEPTTHIDLHGMEILVVDDEPFNLMLAEVILKKYGAIITVAVNGKEAFDKIELQNFDIVLADLHMPEVDGYMLANKIREKYLQVPLIALTANVMQNDMVKIKKSGFNDILLKPYKEKALLDIIAKYAPVVIGEHDPENPQMQLETNSDLKAVEEPNLYSLDEIRKFADNDNSILVAIVESFIQNNSLNLFTLKDASEKNDLHTVRNTAHKMLPSYNHFHVLTLISDLKKLEIVEEISPVDLINCYYQIEKVSKEVFTLLEQDCRTLCFVK